MIFANPVSGYIHPAEDVTAPGIFHVAQDFGCTHFHLEPPLGSCDHFHRGLDISDKECGAPILAAASGVVALSATDPSNGENYIWLDHGSGWFTLYGHLARRIVLRGAKVATGQQIGNLGRTGDATACHLHWGVKSGAVATLGLNSDKNGTWEDPWTHLQQNQGADVPPAPILTPPVAALVDIPAGETQYQLDAVTPAGKTTTRVGTMSPYAVKSPSGVELRAIYVGTAVLLAAPSKVYPPPTVTPTPLAPGIYKVG